jgi:hypothetical protein
LEGLTGSRSPSRGLLHNYNTYSLLQTVDVAHGPMLKAVNDKGEIIVSVRAHPEPGRAVGILKLVVESGYQRRGIGIRLPRAMEVMFPSDNPFCVSHTRFQRLLPFVRRRDG